MKSTRKELQFDEQEIQLLFGCETAEDESRDRLRKYYYKTHVYNQVITDLPLRVLVGHKGIGKSALFQVAMSEEEEQNKLVVLIKPDDVIDIGKKSTSFMEMIREWKAGIIEIVARKVLINLDIPEKNWSKNIKNLGGKLTDYLLQILDDMSEINMQFAKKEIIHQYQKSKSIYIYIDDLDRGWEGKKEDINRLSALLNAVRDLSTEKNRLFFRIALRSDVYFLVRTSDESTDKIEGSVIWHTWSNNDIFLLWIKRVESFFGNEIDEHTLRHKKQKELAYLLNRIMENRFLGVGHWRNAPMYRVFMSLIRQRPRDLVKLCTLAARNTYERRGNLISTLDVKKSFEEYSQGRMRAMLESGVWAG
ncbi:MAG: ATP-binding protein [Gammaproteobacteria bacterium]|nr:ATP-binding protein [Gammaproteobacteria bacterium]MYG96459.1 ATP-binding protein [Gammaproteobacteria bacterium]